QIIVDDDGHIMKYDKPTTAKTISNAILDEVELDKSELYSIYKNTKKLFKTIADSIIQQRDPINKVENNEIIKDMSGESESADNKQSKLETKSKKEDIIEAVYPAIEKELNDLKDITENIEKLRIENDNKFNINNIIMIKELDSKKVNKLVEINNILKELELEDKVIATIMESINGNGEMSKSEIQEIVEEIPDKVKREIRKKVIKIDDLNAEISVFRKLPTHINIIEKIDEKQKTIKDLYAEINEIANNYNKPLDDVIKEMRKEFKIKEIKPQEIEEKKKEETFEEKDVRVRKEAEESMNAISDFMNL
ncbi:hypothetical protein V6O07_23020, partial [Arthrospira platensis SPKY2]